MVAFMETASPAITFVPDPVVEALAMVLTGEKDLEVKYSVIITNPMVTTKPIIEVKNKFRDEIFPKPCGKIAIVRI
jgi:ABC-type tungstate transport system permease subunit